MCFRVHQSCTCLSLCIFFPEMFFVISYSGWYWAHASLIFLLFPGSASSLLILLLLLQHKHSCLSQLSLSLTITFTDKRVNWLTQLAQSKHLRDIWWWVVSVINVDLNPNWAAFWLYYEIKDNCESLLFNITTCSDCVLTVPGRQGG